MGAVLRALTSLRTLRIYSCSMQEIANILREELALRQTRNRSYSLRAFSRDLGVSAASLSECLNGRRQLSVKNLNSIAKHLGYQPGDLGVHIRASNSQQQGQDVLRDDEFKLISNWYYIAIMNLAKLKTCRADARWIAMHLNLDIDVVRIATERLIRLKYIKSQNGRLIRTRRNLRTTFDVPSEAIRSYHRQALDNAKQALQDLPPSEREFISLTAAVNSTHTANAKELIRKFVNELNLSMQKGVHDEVYTLNVQLFPITKISKTGSS